MAFQRCIYYADILYSDGGCEGENTQPQGNSVRPVGTIKQVSCEESVSITTDRCDGARYPPRMKTMYSALRSIGEKKYDVIYMVQRWNSNIAENAKIL